MKRKTLTVLLALAAAAPAIVSPQLANAQTPDRAEYVDTVRDHWAYDAINTLSQAGIIEGYEDGTFRGNKPMTRYEFAVAIARLLRNLPPATATGPGIPGPVGPQGPAGAPGPIGPVGPGFTGDLNNYVTQQQLRDAITALTNEFRDELGRLGIRVDDLERRLAALENRVTPPPRLTITPAFLHRTGWTDYISNGSGAFLNPGRTIFQGNNVVGGPAPLPAQPADYGTRMANKKYSYTDMEVRMTDRISDRLSVNAALRSLGSTIEDPWAGDSGGGVYVREANAIVDLSDRSLIGIKGGSLRLGRQRTQIGQGLLYSNDLQPTDQIHGAFNIGPITFNAFVGTTNNRSLLPAAVPAANNPYITEGANRYFGLSGVAVAGGGAAANASGAAVGFPGFGPLGGIYSDDNESAIRAGFNLFRISGQPVSLGITRMFDGVQDQRGDSIDLSLPLFNRTIGIEYVRQRAYFNGGVATGSPNAYNITLPLLRTRVIDLNVAYGSADDNFEYFLASSANPFARSYGEALFDRPMALGAPMINGAGGAGAPAYAAAKKVWDITGTLRVIRRLPLEFRYFDAEGSRLAATGARMDLGKVYSVGTTFNLSPGLDLELKYGRYNPDGAYPNIDYYRVGASVGF